MNQPGQYGKRVGELRFEDFEDHGVWTWSENDADESRLMPLETGDLLPDGFDALFVLGELTLEDGTMLPGILGIRMHDRGVFLLSIREPNGGLLDISLQPSVRDLAGPPRLVARLQKRISDVFPIRYHTRYQYEDGKPVDGSLEWSTPNDPE